MSLPADLLRAYERADYVVFGVPELVFHVGQANPDLDALMEFHEVSTAAYLSAANPEGMLQAEEKNREAHQELLASSVLKMRPWYEGEGRDPWGKWPAEPSVLVLGVTRDEAEFSGTMHAQKAIVFIEKGRAPELVVLA